jgi:pyruvate/2-oxoglutarate dehydrogenase complex dihydrolipoamide acyltransferase (E2) component
LQVTVDVRSPEAGVVTAVHAKANDNVAVGAALFSLDTEGKATVGSAPPAPLAAAPAPAPAAAPASAPAAASHAAASRKPSIHFKFGKREAIDAESGLVGGAATAAVPAVHSAAAQPQSAASAATCTGDWDSFVAQTFPSKASKDYLDLPSRYSRPGLTEAEMFVISSGGCEYVPPAPPKAAKGKKQ